MSVKMKLALLVLAFLTPFSVAFLLSAITVPNSTPLDASIMKQIPTITSYDDTDNDGLSNRDENLWRTDWKNPDTDGDGFLDGEEVLSGRDPRRAGPNDFLDKSKNLTQRFGSLFVGGALSGDIGPGISSTVQTVGTITDDIFDEYERFAMISQKDITLNIVEDTDENLMTYIIQIAPYLNESFPDALRYAEDFVGNFGSIDPERTKILAGNEESIQAMKAEVIRIELEMNELSQALIDMPVPKSMARPHLNGIILLQSIANEALSASLLNTDPLKATLATTSLISLLTRTATGFAYDYGSTLKISIDNIFTDVTLKEPNE